MMIMSKKCFKNQVSKLLFLNRLNNEAKKTDPIKFNPYDLINYMNNDSYVLIKDSKDVIVYYGDVKSLLSRDIYDLNKPITQLGYDKYAECVAFVID